MWSLGAKTQPDPSVEKSGAEVEVLVLEDFGVCFLKVKVLDRFACCEFGAQDMCDEKLPLAFQMGACRCRWSSVARVETFLGEGWSGAQDKGCP